MISTALHENPIDSEMLVETLGRVGRWRETEGKDVYWSDQLYELYGLDQKVASPSEKLRKSMMHPADLRQYKLRYDALLAYGEDLSACSRVLRADGSVRRLLFRVSRSDLRSSESIVYNGVAIDVTDLYDSISDSRGIGSDPLDAALKVSLLNALTNDASVLITTVRGKILYANSTFLEQGGFSQNDLLGENIRFLDIGFRGPDFLMGPWRSALRGEKWSGEINHRRRDGRLYRTFTKINPVKNDAGDTEFLAVVLSDIAQIQPKELIITENKRRLRALRQLGDLGLFTVDIATLTLTLSDEIRWMLDIDEPRSMQGLKTFVDYHVAKEDRERVIQLASYFGDIGYRRDCEKQIELKLLGRRGRLIFAKIRLIAGLGEIFGVLKVINLPENLTGGILASRLRAEKMLANVPAIVLKLNSVLQICQINASGARLLGIQSLDKIGESVFQLIPEDRRSGFQQGLDKSCALAGESYSWETVMLTHDNSHLKVRVSAWAYDDMRQTEVIHLLCEPIGKLID